MHSAAFRWLLLGLTLSFCAQAQDEADLQSRLRAHVEYLTGLQPARNFDNPESLDRAAGYIGRQFESAGWFVKEQPYEVKKNIYRNLSARRGDRDKPRVVVGAHYDVHGELPGADDNASAVAVMIEVARVLGSYQPSTGLEFVAYTLEENPAYSMGMMGSDQHAASLAKNRRPVRLMMSLEMLGYYTDEPGSQSFPLPGLSWWYPDTGNFLALIGRFSEFSKLRRMAAVMNETGELPVHYLASPVRFDGISRSDHRNYWEHDFPAIMVTDSAFYRNPNYHKITDTADTLDYARMAQLVPQLAAAIRDLCEGN